MTNEQMNTYEELDSRVQLSHDRVTHASLALAGLRITSGERVEAYASRVQDAIDTLNVERLYLDEAKASKRAFIKSLCV